MYERNLFIPLSLQGYLGPSSLTVRQLPKQLS